MEDVRERFGRDFWTGSCAPVVVAVVVFVLYAILAVAFYPRTDYDAINRYAVMAEEFADGNFKMAFHPRFGVFFQVLTGTLCWMTGIPGLVSCQLLSTAGWCFAAIPLWHFARRLGGVGCAWWSVFLLFIVPEYLDYAGTGLRDGVKVFAFATIAYGCVFSRIWLAVGIFILVTLRVDGMAIGFVYVAVYAAYQLIFKKRFRGLVLPAAALCLGLACDSWMCYCYTGYFVPCVHCLRLL